MDQPDVMGIVIAAGHASRLGGLPFSKELLPVRAANNEDAPTEPVCLCLLRAMRTAGIRRVIVVARPGKWDLLGFLSDGNQLGLEVAYLLPAVSLGAAHSLELACGFVGPVRVAMGFPDIRFSAEEGFSKLAEVQRSSNADAVIGTFPSAPGQRADRVQVDEHGVVLKIDPAAPPSDPRPSWCLACWTPRFTEFLLRHIRSGGENAANRKRQGPVGDLLQAAINAELRMMAAPVSTKPFVDVGSPEGLSTALRGVD